MANKKKAPVAEKAVIAKSASKQRLSEEFDSQEESATEKENMSPNKQATPTTSRLSPKSTLSIPKKKRLTLSKRSELTFPVSRVLGKLRKGKLVAKHIQIGEKSISRNQNGGFNFSLFYFDQELQSTWPPSWNI